MQQVCGSIFIVRLARLVVTPPIAVLFHNWQIYLVSARKRCKGLC